jgi:hypothetical protein
VGGVKADREPRAPNSSRHWVVALLMACGARDALPGADGYATTSGAGGPVLLEDCEPSDVRLCGGPTCPPADLTECPGVGCTAVSHRNTGERLELGVCWPDLDNWVNEVCFRCEDGEVCVHHTDGQPYCAPFEVCAALNTFGAGDACRYSDRSAFTGEPLAVGDGCPSRLCGPGCDCLGGVCVGRSADKPFGLCVRKTDDRTCSPTDRTACADSTCAVFQVGSEDQPYANSRGLCVDDSACFAAEARGYVTCYAGQ